MPTAIATIPAMGLMNIVWGLDTSHAKKPSGPTTRSVEKYVMLCIERARTPNTTRINPKTE
jgi:hypothetical protein